MFISKLSGGLGNQLFQYAAGRSLALHNKSALFLDVSFYLKSPNRIFNLNEFNVDAKVVSPKEIYNILGESKNYIFDKLSGRKRFDKNHPLIYKEKYFHFDPAVLQLKPPVLLDGYWQSSKYFFTYADIIRRELTFRNTLQFEKSGLLRRLKNQNSVAIHLRRGDFISNKEINEIHGICTDEYYLKAAELIRQKVNNAIFCIFSDDINAADDLINKLGGGMNISMETNHNQFFDFYLMQHCSHVIMANSTFSWWAAWLNENMNKLVIAPENWFRNTEINTSDLYVDSWITL